MIYDLLAPIYDKVNADINYTSWADFVEKQVERFCSSKPELVLDLGCGTGRMTCELASRGYDMIGVDYSAEMLDIARESSYDKPYSDKLLWLCQDISEFELYGTVGLTVCCLDTVNHLTSPKTLSRCFSLVHNYSDPDGLFLFDINGKIKFENIYGNNTYVMEEQDCFCVWENYYDPKKKLCDFYITLFKEGEDGRYERYDQTQTERMYTVKQIKSYLQKAGFEFLGAYSDFDFNVADDSSERIYFAARCIK